MFENPSRLGQTSQHHPDHRHIDDEFAGLALALVIAIEPTKAAQPTKHQLHLEKRHFLCKSVLEISPVFLKNNDRIETLMFIYFVAQLVAALIERAIRQNMARRQIKALPILPEGRYSKTPSWAQIPEAFALRAKHELYENDRLIQVFIDPLTELQQTLLQLLEIDATVYR